MTVTVHRTLPMTLKIPSETEATFTLEDHTQSFQEESLPALMSRVLAAMGREVAANGAEYLPVTIFDATAEGGPEIVFGLVNRNGTISEDQTPDPREARKAKVAFAKWSAEIRDAALPTPAEPEGLEDLFGDSEPSPGREEPEEGHRGWTGLVPAVSEEATEKVCEKAERGEEWVDEPSFGRPVTEPNLDFRITSGRHDPLAYVDNVLADTTSDEELSELVRNIEARGPEVEEEDEENLSTFRMKTLAEVRDGKTIAAQGVQGRLNALGLTLPPGALETDYLRDVKTISEAPWDTPKRIAIGNPKGGVLKSTTILLSLGVLARNAPITSVLVDFNEAIGNSRVRSGVLGNTTDTTRTFAQWVERLGREPSRTEIRRFMRAHPKDRYHHLSAHKPQTFDDRMLGHEVQDVYAALDTAYDLIAADTGNSMDRESWAVTMQSVDQLIITIVDKDSYDGAVEMMRTLILWGGEMADLARNAIVVITNKGNRLSKAKIAEYRADWEKQVTGGVFVIPNDKHQPADGLSIDRLRFRTLAAYTKVAAQITRALHAEV